MSYLAERPILATVAASALTLLAVGCTSGLLVSQGRYFQYLNSDGKVVGEYMTSDTATCERHLANLQRSNTHATEGVRCSTESAAASLPITAAARQTEARVDYQFRFATMEQCQRMMPAVRTGATITADCR